MPRAAIEDFVAAQGVAYLDDPSNADPHYARNRLRLAALPALRDAFPQADAALARSAAWLGESLTVQQGLLDGILGEATTVLPWQALCERFDAATCKALLRRWLQRAGQPLPPAARLLSFIEALAGNGHAELRYGATVVVQHRGALHLFQASTPQAPPPFAPQTVWPGVGELSLRAGAGLLAGRDCRWALYPCAAHWQAPGRRYAESLKNVLQRKGVPPWLRRRLPLLVVDGECAWLGGFGAAAAWQGLVFDWQKQAHFVNIRRLF